MGRHSTAMRRHHRLLLPAIATAVVAMLGAGTWIAVSALKTPSPCTPAKVTIAASPDIAPAVTLVVHGLDLPCATIDVESRDATQIAESLALSDGSPRPQLWLPDSTLALRRARQLGAPDVADSGPSVASSPIVLAVDAGAAKGLGWPTHTLGWADVLNSAEAGIVTGIPDPARDPVGTAALLGLRDVVKTAADPAGAYVALLRRFSANTLGGADDLLARLPGSSAGEGSPAVTAFPASENSVLRHNNEVGAAPLVAVYSKAVPTLDYPLAELGGITPAQRPVVDALSQALLGGPGADAIAKTGLRAAGAQALRDHTADPRVSPIGQQSANLPSAAETEQLLSQWAGVNLSARVQVLIDISGSMNAPVPGTGLTRIQLTVAAAQKALHLFKPTTQLRILTFSTQLDGDKDYREVLPMAPVSQQLANGAEARLGQITAITDGGTGLYDSVLDVYRTARREWEAGRFNLVIVLTDGHNDDADGISRADLLTELGKLQDARRPLPLIGVGIGPDADKAELDQLTAATGGSAFLAPDPAKITEVFFAALSRIAAPR